MSLLPSRKAAKIIGVHPNTLRNWDKQGKINTVRTPSGQRLYNVNEFIQNQKCKEKQKCEETTIKICYARVSSKRQEKDLKRHKKYCKKNIRKQKLLQKLVRALIMKENVCVPFWNKQCQELASQLASQLSLPTKTDSQDLDSNSSNILLKGVEGKSWYSTTINYLQNKNSQKICSQLSTP
jgi:DNA-binding transcriptional MerR regulator